MFERNNIIAKSFYSFSITILRRCAEGIRKFLFHLSFSKCEQSSINEHQKVIQTLISDLSLACSDKGQ